MNTTERLSSNPILDWWIEVQPSLYDFSQLLEISPAAHGENATSTARELRDLYEAIQRTDCPMEVDKVYQHFTQAILNLFACYEAAAQGKWRTAEILWGLAISDWIYTKTACHAIGIFGFH